MKSPLDSEVNRVDDVDDLLSQFQPPTPAAEGEESGEVPPAAVVETQWATVSEDVAPPAPTPHLLKVSRGVLPSVMAVYLTAVKAPETVERSFYVDKG